METATAKRVATALFIIAVVFLLVTVYIGFVFWENTLDLGAEFIASLDLVFWVVILGSIFLAILIALLIVYALSPVRGHGVPATDDGLAVDAAFEPIEPDAFVESPMPMAFEELPSETLVAEPEPVYDVAPVEPEPVSQVYEPAPEPVFEPAPPPKAVDADVDALLVRCSNCSNEFEIPYSDERPLRATCPKCNEVAVLTDEDLPAGDGDIPVIEIEGIGPVFAEKLIRSGVHTTEQLRIASPKRLADATGIPLASIKTWQAMSDFLRVPGIGKQFAELLARTGVPSVKALAGENAKQLARKVKAFTSTLDVKIVKAGVDEKRAKTWIAAAKKIK